MVYNKEHPSADIHIPIKGIKIKTGNQVVRVRLSANMTILRINTASVIMPLFSGYCGKKINMTWLLVGVCPM